MKKRLGMNSILREKKGQWWENNGFHTERGKGSMLVNFILHFFLEILQRFCEVGILGNFGRPGHAHNDWMVLYRRIVWCLSTCKKSTSSLLSFLRYWKDIIWTCYFGYFGTAWLWPVKMPQPLWYLSSFKKSYLSLTYFLKYYKHLAKFLFWVLWACLATPTNSTNL